MKKMTGRGPKNRDIDQALYTWYCDRYQLDLDLDSILDPDLDRDLDLDLDRDLDQTLYIW